MSSDIAVIQKSCLQWTALATTIVCNAFQIGSGGEWVWSLGSAAGTDITESGGMNWFHRIAPVTLSEAAFPSLHIILVSLVFWFSTYRWVEGTNQMGLPDAHGWQQGMTAESLLAGKSCLTSPANSTSNCSFKLIPLSPTPLPPP